MNTYKYNENLQFELPTGLLHFIDKNENGDEMNLICTEKIIDNDGEAEYKNRIDIVKYEIEPGKKSDKDIEKLFRQRNAGFGFLSGENPTITYSLPGESDAVFVSGRFNWEIYGMQFFNYITALFLVCDDNTGVAINVVNSRFGEGRDLSKYQQFIDVIKTIRFNGKKLNTENLTPQILYDKLEKSLDDFDGVSKTYGSEEELEGKIMEALGNILGDNEDDVQSDKFSRALPDQTLYPHYYGLQDRMRSLGSLGVEVRMNTSGTEYQFINFTHVIKEREEDFWDEDQEEKEELPLQEILDLNPIGYTLDETAKKMAQVFHVNSFVFNDKSDREAEILNGLMQKAYMMSALRSFAWTLADYCKKNSKKPKDLELSLLLEMIDFIEACDWLNYDDKKYCKGLCSNQDLHVFFLPDAVSKSDKDKFLPSEEDYERVRKMRETFPAYDEMLSQVGSLDKLRKDLEYIYPAINTLYNYLKKDRDTSEQLEGNAAVVLYAWCALSIAASEPFFTEDGPMNYSFSQEDYDDNYDYDNDEDYDDDDDGIVYVNHSEIDSSGTLTSYFGNDKEVVVPDGVKAIGDRAFLYCEMLEHIELPSTLETIGEKAFSSCINLEKIKLPEGLKFIGESAFNKCKKLEKIELPEGLKFIGESAFDGCEKLEKIKLPEGLKFIGMSAFYECERLEKIELPKQLKTISGGLFEKCSNIQSLKLPEALQSIEEHAFASCSALETLDLPRKIKNIENHVFMSSGIKTINWPRLTKNIEDGTFYKCQQLENITFEEGLESIGKEAFSGCIKLEKIILPNSIKSIGYRAFMNCELLKEVILSQNLEKVGEEAFNGCCNIEKLILTGSIKKIEKGAFKKCKQLKEVYVPVDFKAPFKDAFLKSVVFYVVKGSWADKYAQEEKFKVQYIEEDEIICKQGLAYLSLGDIDSAKKILKGNEEGEKIINEYLKAEEEKKQEELKKQEEQRKEEERRKLEEEQKKLAEDEAHYKDAVKYKEEKKYDAAKSIFQQIIDYKDSKKLIEEIDKEVALKEKYSRAIKYENSGKYEEAIIVFESLGEYSDSKERVEIVREKEREIKEKGRIYSEAAQCEKDGNLDEAEKLFESLGNYSNSAMRLGKIRKVKEQQNRYSIALQYVKEKKYTEAEEIFDELRGFSDSKKMIKEIRKKRGVCRNCGGKFEGFLVKKCIECGEKKDY